MFRFNLSLKLVCFLIAQLIVINGLVANNEQDFIDRANLAIRQAGHQLLLIQNDSSSTIPPIKFSNKLGFSLKINELSNYDTLPNLLKQAFADYEIDKGFNLIVKDCDKNHVYLGYSSLAAERGETTCKGRDIEPTCANLFVRFSEPIRQDQKNKSYLLLLLIPIIAITGFSFYKNQKTELKPDHIVLGQFIFDKKNHTLRIGDEEQHLTFRENKLLYLFASQPNKILNRSEILSAVWEDEGVIVSRSLDVFISRLRKLLKADPSVQIKNIHSVGYRLDVPDN